MARRQDRHIDTVEQIYVAGTVVPAGSYQLVGSKVVLVMEEEGHLPATLDGKVACYEPVRPTWRDLSEQRFEQGVETSGARN